MRKDKQILIAGGAGFIGSHLCEAYLAEGAHVTCIDNTSTGRKQNIRQFIKEPNFSFHQVDICESLPAEVTKQKYDFILNLASPASPPKYQELAIETLLVGAIGTKNLLDLARRDNARFFHASTSEVYGDPTVHPQLESYYGNVNSYGPRAMYDEAKRFSEALIYVYRNKYGLSTGTARIFNTYGPGMDPEDGRVVSNFITQALAGKPLTIYGDGSQTRSFCYVDDLVKGIMKLAASDEEGPINLGNPSEFTVLELADQIIELAGTQSKLEHHPLPVNDPTQRQPNISKAKAKLAWEPRVSLHDGLGKTITYFRETLGISSY
ncbi:MAG TPA: UDP-glucuronic acid decarboxylase family protein [Candidatus Saccharimonadales bacterium]|nr:UDP-glucuronic acid decarboxylase family protein [Candidatus Saccharimonadales bacterium]